MCLAIPRKVLEVNGKEAVVDCDGEKKKVMSLLNLEPGNYVIVSSGIVVEKISKEEAENALKVKIMDSE
jgi:hydrogenase assembly chaperone HypC/HupF